MLLPSKRFERSASLCRSLRSAMLGWTLNECRNCICKMEQLLINFDSNDPWSCETAEAYEPKSWRRVALQTWPRAGRFEAVTSWALIRCLYHVDGGTLCSGEKFPVQLAQGLTCRWIIIAAVALEIFATSGLRKNCLVLVPLMSASFCMIYDLWEREIYK